MKIVPDFFNKLAREIDAKYFPEVKYYGDNKNTVNIHRAIELFNNGCLTYPKLIKKLAISCSDTEKNIHNIVSKHIEDFGEFVFYPPANSQS